MTRIHCPYPWRKLALMMHFVFPKTTPFAHSRFSTLFFSMKMAETATESEKIMLESYIIDFDNIQVWLRRFNLNLNESYDNLIPNSSRTRKLEIIQNSLKTRSASYLSHKERNSGLGNERSRLRQTLRQAQRCHYEKFLRHQHKNQLFLLPFAFLSTVFNSASTSDRKSFLFA